ncbi:mechanosensitive ion channel protein 2, chloroplastic isoform X1 [Selaginella moellendorffii]|uniref:mechanosensitive ion channel protein 2, chloroplastic isoform X1 n=1 Tax=Selaginella moellendorffii TaxID=88036 RepID=UPI000D1C8F15|nr:mechanosensitive ion channel protein 2, chloroplastic isoform X1 [Selaginella moellendorffii]|eukprot:XP_024530130.1 mechanosensitive ion channel protein 2, chloroplastic isoform X1 [Selaginella moellendorffii]
MAVMNALRIGQIHGSGVQFKRNFQSWGQAPFQPGLRSSNCAWLYNQDLWCVHLWASLRAVPKCAISKPNAVSSCLGLTSTQKDFHQIFSTALAKVLSVLKAHPVFSSCAPPLAMIFFAVYGLLPTIKMIQQGVFGKESWHKSQTEHILVAYVRPLLIWMGVISICGSIDPVVLSSGASQAIKDRSINFVRSLSTVLAFAVCATNLTEKVQKSLETRDSDKGRNLGIQFISNAVRSSVWVAAVCLFMELLGFSTQKWITAGGLGTVLVTLAGREILTNFLSSIMIHATRPFIENQWIQTKIEGQEVSGTVEHVGWWSPTVIRGDDREAVHIPNHKFTVSVVRNLSQKTHWRIKTHLAISHLDAGKIALIVADMRKVLAKHSQVEHKRLHRRVFLDYVHPESQALHVSAIDVLVCLRLVTIPQSFQVLVSCFVKTSRFEEYLRVKETILLDILKVISHHNARLATPIRSIHRVSADEPQQAPASKYDRPLLISETSVLSSEHPLTRSKSQSEIVAENIDKSQGNPGEAKPQLAGLDSMGLNSKDITLLGAAFGKSHAKLPVEEEESPQPKPAEIDGENAQVVRGKIYVQDDVKEQIVGSVRAVKGDGNGKKGLPRSSSVEENLVLGVALDGSKRTLPLNGPETNIDVKRL